MIITENNGPQILSSTYWDSDQAAAGKLHVSVNAGAVRLLLPRSGWHALADMSQAKEIVLSREPWPEQQVADAFELLFEDGTGSPYAVHLVPQAFDVLPAQPRAGEEWICSVWTRPVPAEVPRCNLHRVCHWRRVPQIPWMKPWPDQRPG